MNVNHNPTQDSYLKLVTNSFNTTADHIIQRATVGFADVAVAFVAYALTDFHSTKADPNRTRNT